MGVDFEIFIGFSGSHFNERVTLFRLFPITAS